MSEADTKNILALHQTVFLLDNRLREAEKLISAQNAAIATTNAKVVELETSLQLLRIAQMGRNSTAR